ncbi:MAG: hypothetical protein Q8N28_02795 [bacterium]|nr:hypothetical protein [bacterium]
MIKKIIIVIVIVIVLFAIYFGSILPFKKAQLYIKSAYQMPSLKTPEDFKKVFDKLFGFYSPIGDYEAARFLGNNLVNAVANPKNPEIASRYLVEYLEPKMRKDETRHLLILAQIYFFLWEKSGNENDFLKSEEYYREALIYGPKLPPVLYNLFDLYRLRGDEENTRKIGEKILKYWPEDERVKAILNQ